MPVLIHDDDELPQHNCEKAQIDQLRIVNCEL
jgi:hypothetical protein